MREPVASAFVLLAPAMLALTACGTPEEAQDPHEVEQPDVSLEDFEQNHEEDLELGPLAPEGAELELDEEGEGAVTDEQGAVE